MGKFPIGALCITFLLACAPLSKPGAGYSGEGPLSSGGGATEVLDDPGEKTPSIPVTDWALLEQSGVEWIEFGDTWELDERLQVEFTAPIWVSYASAQTEESLFNTGRAGCLLRLLIPRSGVQITLESNRKYRVYFVEEKLWQGADGEKFDRIDFAIDVDGMTKDPVHLACIRSDPKGSWGFSAEKIRQVAGAVFTFWKKE